MPFQVSCHFELYTPPVVASPPILCIGGRGNPPLSSLPSGPSPSIRGFMMGITTSSIHYRGRTPRNDRLIDKDHSLQFSCHYFFVQIWRAQSSLE